jgi:hypothetical protein
MKLKNLITVILILAATVLQAQKLTQSVRGKVIDAQATYPLNGATVVVKDSNPQIGTITDASGEFSLENVPVGRQTLIISYIGYRTVQIPNILVNSAKESYIEVSLDEDVTQLEEAVVIGKKANEQTQNEIALISSRGFTVEEASRYAGSMNDPARMAANYAGVSTTGDTRNDIVVRGNSPNGIMYRLKGVNIPNPNHFGTYGGSGGYYSMFSQNTLSNSDFLTGAFPAQYGNALGGVFDIKLRKGNNQKREYAFTFGLNGIELTAEGPFSKKSKASYLINYRYSTVEALDALGADIGVSAVPKYQDLTFKTHFPLKKGYIKVFGLGGTANIDLKDSEAEGPEDFFSKDKPSDSYSGTRLGIIGVSNKYFFNEKTFGEITFTASQSYEEYYMDSLAAPDYKIASKYRDGYFKEDKYNIQYDFSSKISAKHLFVAGIQSEILDLDFEELNVHQENETKYAGTTGQMSAYAQWMYRINDLISVTGGLHGRYFELIDHATIEPRISAKWQINEKHSLNGGFGLHSQTLPSYAYFIEGENDMGETYLKYRNVKPSMSEHYILGYNYQITENLRLKVDGYYQYLFDIPVEETPSYWSAVNVGGEFDGFPADLDKLVNKGTGRNMGIELTLEKFLSKGYYYLFTTSLYDSKYEGSDGKERNTAFNGNYVFNLLGGKEFKVGKNKQNVFAIDLKSTLAGGRRKLPIDYQATLADMEVVYDETNAYEKKYRDYFRTDLKFSYRINKPKVTHEFVLDLQNITNNENLFRENYNITDNSFSKEYQQGLFPNFQYRILF